MTILDIQIMLILASVSCAVLALIRLAEERAAWEDNKKMLSDWLKSKDKKQIASLRGKVTKLKKKLEAVSGK